MNTTPVSLLEQLRQPAALDAWPRFVKLYAPLLCYWARRLGLQEPDAADLVQEVFVVLVQKLPTFNYQQDKSFRNWLRTVMQNLCRNRCQRRPPGARTGDTAALAALAAPESLDISEKEYRQHLIRQALHLMQTEFSPSTWRACWEHVVNGRAAAEVASELGISIGFVYVAKSRVLCRLREELQGLLDEASGAA